MKREKKKSIEEKFNFGNLNNSNSNPKIPIDNSNSLRIGILFKKLIFKIYIQMK